MVNYSIIIPHRGAPELLQRLLDSIPQRPDVQVIVIDDPDGRGGGYARNQALPQATGRWLLFADADDFYAEGFLDVLDAYVNRDDLDAVYFGFLADIASRARILLNGKTDASKELTLRNAQTERQEHMCT